MLLIRRQQPHPSALEFPAANSDVGNGARHGRGPRLDLDLGFLKGALGGDLLLGQRFGAHEIGLGELHFGPRLRQFRFGKRNGGFGSFHGRFEFGAASNIDERRGRRLNDGDDGGVLFDRVADMHGRAKNRAGDRRRDDIDVLDLGLAFFIDGDRE